MGQLTLSMGPARVEVHSFVQRASIPGTVRELSFTLIKATQAINIIYMCCHIVCVKNTFSPMQAKNKPQGRDSEHVFILGSMDCMVANNFDLSRSSWG
jgi:hypothetical protein